MCALTLDEIELRQAKGEENLKRNREREKGGSSLMHVNMSVYLPFKFFILLVRSWMGCWL